jgi:hypothetical protein
MLHEEKSGNPEFESIWGAAGAEWEKNFCQNYNRLLPKRN